MAVGHRARVVVARLAAVPLAHVLVHVALELPAQRVVPAAAAAYDVLQRYVLRDGRAADGRLDTHGRRAVAVDGQRGRRCGRGRGRLRPVVQVVPAVQLPVPLAPVRVSPHAALHGHQERADRQHQAADVQEPRVPRRHDGRHDQQEAHRDAGEIEHLWCAHEKNIMVGQTNTMISTATRSKKGA